MTNHKLIELFFKEKGTISRKCNNLSISNGKLFSYETVIAQFIDVRLLYNITYYSNTTSRHQNLVYKNAINRNIDIIRIGGIKIGTKNL